MFEWPTQRNPGILVSTAAKNHMATRTSIVVMYVSTNTSTTLTLKSGEAGRIMGCERMGWFLGSSRSICAGNLRISAVCADGRE